MLGVGGKLCRPTYLTSLFTQGYLHPIAQDFVLLAFEPLKAIWMLYNSLGYHCQCLVTLMVKKCFLFLRQNLLCFSLCLVLLIL